jgi:hypothetical protein
VCGYQGIQYSETERKCLSGADLLLFSPSRRSLFRQLVIVANNYQKAAPTSCSQKKWKQTIYPNPSDKLSIFWRRLSVASKQRKRLQ